MFQSVCSDHCHPPDKNQSTLIETLSCQPHSFLFRTKTTQREIFTWCYCKLPLICKLTDYQVHTINNPPEKYFNWTSTFKAQEIAYNYEHPHKLTFLVFAAAITTSTVWTRTSQNINRFSWFWKNSKNITTSCESISGKLKCLVYSSQMVYYNGVLPFSMQLLKWCKQFSCYFWPNRSFYNEPLQNHGVSGLEFERIINKTRGLVAQNVYWTRICLSRQEAQNSPTGFDIWTVLISNKH